MARTTWVRNALEELSGLETRLVAFSDDMDGLRKVPLNLPQPDMLAQHLGKPLHAIPDPFGERRKLQRLHERQVEDVSRHLPF